MRHVSEYGLEGPPEQETDIIEANTRANDKWAQEGTHGPKGRLVGPLGGRPTSLVSRAARGPHRLQVPRGGSLLDA